ncbi:MAG: hypothetical protein K2P94_17190 [Rhodospirillaceae bacterium]|nr:hypothetical protein [Rhodospirillaceae bacterium]
MVKSKKHNVDRSIQLNARVPAKLVQHLRIVLAADDLTYQEWLETRIKQYVERRTLSRGLIEAPK